MERKRKKEKRTGNCVRRDKKCRISEGNDFVAAFRSRPQWKLGSISSRVINGRAARRVTLNGRRHKVTATTHVRPESNCENIQCYNMFASTRGRRGGEQRTHYIRIGSNWSVLRMRMLQKKKCYWHYLAPVRWKCELFISFSFGWKSENPFPYSGL
jgi:hypothetical protein